MVHVIICCSITILVLGGYRSFWRRRYGARGVDGSFVRVQGRIASATEVVLQRETGGEILRRGFAVELDDGHTCTVDPSSPWLTVAGGSIRRGATVTVDGLPSVVARQEALYREPSLAPALEALRVAGGAWPELRLLRWAAVFALLLLGAALALPWAVSRSWERSWTHEALPPRLHIDCPRGTRQRGSHPHVWCATPARVPHGPSLEVWEDGSPRETGAYGGGAREGVWISYDNSGIARRAIFRAGVPAGCWERRYAGWVARECFEAGKLHGPRAAWDEQGRLRERGSYRRGLKHGRWSVWDHEAVLRRDGEYREGRRHGRWRFWNEDGGVAAVGRYENGVPHGGWRWWHDTRHLAGSGRYEHGVKQGRWVAWYPSGRREREVIYRDGEAGDRQRSWEEVARR